MYNHDFDHDGQDAPGELQDGPGSTIAAAVVLGLILVVSLVLWLVG